METSRLAADDLEYHLSEHRLRMQDEYLLPLLNGLEIGDGVSFADLGCGSGYINAYLASRHRLHQNTGLELDFDALLLAKQLNAATPSACWLCASAEFIPLASNSIDAIVCRGVVPLARAEKVIEEISRVLKPGGRACILLHHWTFYWRWLRLDPRKWKRNAVAMLHFSLGLWFNLTGEQVQLRYRGKRIGQTWQTANRMKRVLAKYGLDLFKVRQNNEFFIYAVKVPGNGKPQT